MADEIVAVYRAEVEQYKKAVDSLIGKVDALDKAQNKVGDDAQADFGKGAKAVGGMNAQVGSLTESLKKMAVGLGIAFSAQQLVQFGKEVVNIAAKAEGVERAFARIGSPQLLDGLRKATRGTVTDLNLMTTAIQASNFKIPLEELATYLQFATQRANETGKSVDYMVESILTGVGRGSIEVWDNLGFSLGEVRKHLNGVAVESLSVGERAKLMSKLVNEELVKMGDQADTTADHLAQLSTKFDNIKKSIGGAIIEAAKFFEIIDDSKAEGGLLRMGERAKQVAYALGVVNNELRGINDETEKQQALEEKLAQKRAESRRLLKTIQDIEAQRVAITAKVASAETVMQNASNSNQKFKSAAAKEEIARAGVIIKDGEKELSLLKEQRKAAIERLSWTSAYTSAIEQLIAKKKTSNEEDAKEIISIELLKNQLKELQDEFLKTEIGTKRYIELKGLIAAKQDEIKKALGEETDAMKKAREEREKLIKLEETLRKEGVDKDDTSEVDAKIYSEVQAEIDKYNRLKKEREDFNAYLSKKNKEEIRDELEKINEIEEANKDAQEEKEKQKQKEREAFIEFGEMAISLINGIAQAQAAASQYELQILDEQLEQGQISRERYDEERRRIMRKQATDAKALGILEAVIATAVAVTKAYPNIPLAIIAGVLGAIQIGVIAAQPIPQFATGVIGLQGAGTETSDSIPAMLSRGESVMTAAETRKYRPILEGIRRGTLDEIIRENYVRPAIDAALLNGFADMGNSAALQDRFNDMNLLRAIDRHRESEVGELRQMNVLLGHLVRKPKRGYA